MLEKTSWAVPEFLQLRVNTRFSIRSGSERSRKRFQQFLTYDAAQLLRVLTLAGTCKPVALTTPQVHTDLTPQTPILKVSD